MYAIFVFWKQKTLFQLAKACINLKIYAYRAYVAGVCREVVGIVEYETISTWRVEYWIGVDDSVWTFRVTSSFDSILIIVILKINDKIKGSF